MRTIGLVFKPIKPNKKNGKIEEEKKVIEENLEEEKNPKDLEETIEEEK